MNYWWSADFHLNHKNIIKYSNRPFSNIGEMNEAIMNNWNKCVQPGDTSYFLGDFCFGDEKSIAEFFRRLNGKIKIVFGNHDKTLRKFSKRDILSHGDLKDRIEFLGDYVETTINSQFIVMCHYAFRVWNKRHHGSWNLFAHSHGSLKDDINSRSIDVGVDCHNFFPINFIQIKDIMSKKIFKPVDHHS